jgi:hypothetical protein
MGLFVTISIKETQRYAECHYAECRYAEYRYAEGHGAYETYEGQAL